MMPKEIRTIILIKYEQLTGYVMVKMYLFKLLNLVKRLIIDWPKDYFGACRRNKME